VACVFCWNSNGMGRREYSHWHDPGAAVPSVVKMTDQPHPRRKHFYHGEW
jgi:hypothetical protein